MCSGWCTNIITYSITLQCVYYCSGIFVDVQELTMKKIYGDSFFAVCREQRVFCLFWSLIAQINTTLLDSEYLILHPLPSTHLGLGLSGSKLRRVFQTSFSPTTLSDQFGLQSLFTTMFWYNTSITADAALNHLTISRSNFINKTPSLRTATFPPTWLKQSTVFQERTMASGLKVPILSQLVTHPTQTSFPEGAELPGRRLHIVYPGFAQLGSVDSTLHSPIRCRRSSRRSCWCSSSIKHFLIICLDEGGNWRRAV